MINLLKIIFFFVSMSYSANFFDKGDMMFMSISLIFMLWCCISLFISLSNYTSGEWVYRENNKGGWFDWYLYGEDGSYNQTYYGGMTRNDRRQAHSTYTPQSYVQFDAVKKATEKVKLNNSQIEIISENVRELDIDGLPIKQDIMSITPPPLPKEATKSEVTVAVVNDKPKSKKSSHNAVLIFNNDTFTPKLETVYRTIIRCLTMHYENKRMLYDMIQSIYHVDLMTYSLVIYYRKPTNRFRHTNIDLPKDELIKAIRFAFDDKDFPIEFVEMENKSLTDFYVESCVTKETK